MNLQVGLDPIPTTTMEEVLPMEWLESGRPLELDLGCARGSFLLPMAEQFPDRFFAGIERLTDRVYRTRKKIERAGLGNALVFQGEILATLEEVFPRHCVDWLHLLFPDPWPKRRHAPRRILRPEALTSFAQVAKPNAHFRFLTDSQSYHAEALEVLQSQTCWNLVTTDPAELVAPWPPTEFQSRFVSRDQPLYGWIAAKSC